MKLSIFISLLFVVIFDRINASDSLNALNIPNLMSVYKQLEAKSENSYIPFLNAAGKISDYVEVAAKESQEKRCAQHVLELMYQIVFVKNVKQREKILQKFSSKHIECDQYIPQILF